MVARRYHGKGSLQVELRDDGVAFSFKVPNTQLGNDLLEMIERGEVFDCSFAFIDSGATWDFSGDIPLRTVTNITQLFDFSAVWNGAYSQTEISARSIEEAEEASKAEPATEEVPSNEVSEEPVINTIEEPKEESRDDSYLEELNHYKEIVNSL
jgi:phage head maturation protease